MSSWPIEQVAKWAADAGWRGIQLAEAVAMAIATSGGDDHHVSNPSYTEHLERRGLYGLTRAEADPTHPDELWHPNAATLAAYRHWQRSGSVWSWHPVWASGAGLEAYPVVRAVIEGKVRTPQTPGDRSWAGLIDYLSRFHGAMQANARRLRG